MEKKKITGYVHDLDIYEGLSDQEILCYAHNSRDEKKGRGELIYSPGDPIENIYVLHHGEAQLYHMVHGKKVVFDVLTPGTVFGAFDIDNMKASHYCEIMRDAELCVTPRSEFLNLVSAHPEMLLNMLRKLSDRIQDYERKLEVAAGTAEDKLIYELERQKEKRSRNFLGKFFQIHLKLTHEQLAMLTGLNRITVTRTLKGLKEKGVISLDDKSGAITLNKV